MTDTTRNDNLKTLSLAVWGLYLVSILFGITSIVGLIIAHVKRSETGGTIWESHMIYAIRTFWIMFAVVLVSIPLMFIGIGYLIVIAISIWFIVRSVVGLLRALDQKPIANPHGWLI